MIDLCEVAIEPFGPTATGLKYDDRRVKYHSFKCNTTNYQQSAPKHAVVVMQPATHTLSKSNRPRMDQSVSLNSRR
jgi:hypothetical protein